MTLMNRRKLIPLAFSFLFFLNCGKNTPEVAISTSPPDVDTGELPYIRISTASLIENEPKVPGMMVVFEDQEVTFNAPIGIEYRGSTSFRLSNKKSYGLETWDENNEDVDASLFGFPEEEDWILTGHVFNAANNTLFDPTLIHHYLGYTLYERMGRYASRCKFVELEINNDYKGLYVFMEKLKRDNGRIDIEKMTTDDNALPELAGGYILKIDKTSGGDVAPGQPLSYYETNWADDALYTSENSFRSDYDIVGQPLSIEPYGPPYHANQFLETYFLYDYPKAEEITPAQKNYIQDYVNAFETALINDAPNAADPTYLQFIDLDSFVDFFIINEITGNVDGYRISTFMHKPRNGKLKMGPIWDLNIGYNRQGRVPFDDWIANYNTHVPQDAWMVPFWWTRLLESDVFKARLKQRWQTFRAGALSTGNVVGLVNETSDYLTENGAVERNYNRWDGIDVNYSEVISQLKSYMENRLNWMDSQINGF